jgi:threonine-phosphate decarboxylase
MSETPAHGGNLRLANARYGSKDWLDFSANINPLGLPPALRESLEGALASGVLQRYPDPDSAELRGLFAQKHGLTPEQVLVTNGASEALQLALAALPRGEVALPVPSFSEYGASARLHGHTARPLPMDADSFDIPPPQRRYTGVILGNPNNPTSKLVGGDCLEAWLEACDWVVVDEAFVELTAAGEANSAVPRLSRYPNLIVVRALTKQLSIPGLRLGYALAGKAWIERMRARQIPWSVNALAQAVASSLPGLGGYLDDTKKWIGTEPRRLFSELISIPGLTAWPPDTNFILCRGGQPARRIIAAMAQRGILLRDASNFDGLDERYFRVAVRLRAENERLVQALREVLKWD